MGNCADIFKLYDPNAKIIKPPRIRTSIAIIRKNEIDPNDSLDIVPVIKNSTPEVKLSRVPSNVLNSTYIKSTRRIKNGNKKEDTNNNTNTNVTKNYITGTFFAASHNQPCKKRGIRIPPQLLKNQRFKDYSSLWDYVKDQNRNEQVYLSLVPLGLLQKLILIIGQDIITPIKSSSSSPSPLSSLLMAKEDNNNNNNNIISLKKLQTRQQNKKNKMDREEKEFHKQIITEEEQDQEQNEKDDDDNEEENYINSKRKNNKDQSLLNSPSLSPPFNTSINNNESNMSNILDYQWIFKRVSLKQIIQAINIILPRSQNYHWFIQILQRLKEIVYSNQNINSNILNKNARRNSVCYGGTDLSYSSMQDNNIFGLAWLKQGTDISGLWNVEHSVLNLHSVDTIELNQKYMNCLQIMGWCIRSMNYKYPSAAVEQDNSNHLLNNNNNNNVNNHNKNNTNNLSVLTVQEKRLPFHFYFFQLKFSSLDDPATDLRVHTPNLYFDFDFTSLIENILSSSNNTNSTLLNLQNLFQDTPKSAKWSRCTLSILFLHLQLLQKHPSHQISEILSLFEEYLYQWIKELNTSNILIGLTKQMIPALHECLLSENYLPRLYLTLQKWMLYCLTTILYIN